MKGLGALAVLMALALPAGLAVAGESADYRDDFGSGQYSGNDGSLDFEGPWSEFGDSGGASSGLVHIGDEDCSNNRCLHIEGPGLIAGNFGIMRAADLSDFQTAELSFDLVIGTRKLLEFSSAELQVQVRSGGKWTTLGTYDLEDSYKSHKIYDVSGHLTEDFEIRFLVPELLGAKVANWNGYVTVDRVEVKGLLGSSTSTTSTTRPKTSTSSSSPKPTSTSTTTTSISSTTSTTAPGSTAVNRARAVDGAGGTPDTTTTTVVESTTSTADAVFFVAPTIPPESGLRDPGVGLISDYESGMMGDMEMESVEVLGAELDADFSLAVEYFEAGKLWIALLALVIGAAFVGSLDRRRLRRDSV